MDFSGIDFYLIFDMFLLLLIGMGYSADDAMQLIKEKRSVADPDAWYIQSRIRRFETYWQKNH